jgi:hypothetical protein
MSPADTVSLLLGLVFLSADTVYEKHNKQNLLVRHIFSVITFIFEYDIPKLEVEYQVEVR